MGIAQPYDYTNKNNHYLVTGITYDNMGDVTKDDLLNTYSYDAERRPVTVNSISTTFDAFNRAVEQNRSGVYTQIVYSPTGQKFSYMNGQTLKSYVLPMVAGLQVVYNSSGLQYFRQVDWLGTGRFATNSSGGVYYDAAYGPWGETVNETGTTDRLFTGQTQDSTGGIYDFLFRQHSPTEGRWLVPDPAGLAAVDITNPQTWNRYAYVENNPLSNVDPLGLECASGNQNNFDNPDLLPGSVTTAGTGTCPNENSDPAQPPPKSDHPGGDTQDVLSWNFGPAPGQPGKLPPNYFKNGNWHCSKYVNGALICTPGVSDVIETIDRTGDFVSQYSPAQLEMFAVEQGWTHDYLDPLHNNWWNGGTQLRSPDAVCAVHMTISGTNAQGQATGDWHVDQFNPWSNPVNFVRHGTEVVFGPDPTGPQACLQRVTF